MAEPGTTVDPGAAPAKAYVLHLDDRADDGPLAYGPFPTAAAAWSWAYAQPWFRARGATVEVITKPATMTDEEANALVAGHLPALYAAYHSVCTAGLGYGYDIRVVTPASWGIPDGTCFGLPLVAGEVDRLGIVVLPIKAAP